MVDYSKWDRMNFEDADEDENPKKKPHVTRFQKPTSITLGKEGLEVHSESKQKTPPTTTTINNTSSSSASSSITSSYSSAQTEKGFSVNGAITTTHLWSQTHSEVMIGIFIDENLRAKNLSVELISETFLKVTEKDKGVIFNKELAYKVDPNEDGLVDWEISNYLNEQNEKKRIIKITLKKMSLGEGFIRVWWKKAFIDDSEEVDVSAIPERKKQKETKNVWEEAHKLFLEKKKGPRIDIDTSN
eukprot:c13962_g1_i1.p1 GENE.c13962_g1_i1~~c13962_g1_i1.p1  ORF type:complete len:260 (-),score=118.30 c13962_g1_i1:100-831(-)